MKTRGRKIVTVAKLVLLLLALPGVAQAQFQIIGNFDGHSAILRYTGPGGAVTVPSTIIQNSNTYQITGIWSNAFANCTTVTSVSLPNTIVNIEASAFFGCSSLSSINIPGSVASIPDLAFYACTNLTSVNISPGVTNIGSSAFALCYSLPGIAIPNTVVNIRNQAFDCCYNLASVTIPNSVTSIGNWAFVVCFNLTNITIGSGVTNIGDSAFQQCNLAGVIIPNSVTSIGNGLFYSCTNLGSVTIPSGVTNIGNDAFGFCTKLSSVTIPNTVRSIGDDAFEECNFTNVIIPSSVSNIGPRAFSSCTSLTNVIIGSGVTDIGGAGLQFRFCDHLTNFIVSALNPAYSATNGILFDKNHTTLVIYPPGLSPASNVFPGSMTSVASYAFFEDETLTSVTIPDTVTNIGDFAFGLCNYLTNISIGSSVTSIGDNAFYNCIALTSVIIPNSVSRIGSSAFNNGGKGGNRGQLTSVTIGSGVTNIASSAFAGNPGLTAIYFTGNAPVPDNDSSVFGGNTNGTNYYLAGTTGWGSTFDGLPTSPWKFTVTPLRVLQSQASISPTNLVDDPIMPVTDTNVLAGATNALGLGVVADGVTPVLFNITGPPGNYSIVITNNSTNSNPSFYTNLLVLKNGSWTNITNITIVAAPQTNMGTVFACLRGLDWGQFVSPPPYAPVMITMRVTSTNVVYTNTTTFEVRPPPIALIHGYNADASSWTASFLTNLYNYRPADFVLPLEYGVSNAEIISIIGGGLMVTNVHKEKTGNIKGDFVSLASQVDGLLDEMLGTCQSNWAFTRYDVVGHSQGGVLARMLCQMRPGGVPAFSRSPVVSEGNFYRGRFRRVITIGSPHNGSVILHYVNSVGFQYNYLVADLLGDLAQPKFDPFGDQIKQINNPSLPVDPHIKFNCITTTIASGQWPQPGYDPQCYKRLGLTEGNRGQILLPRGSDGVVDFDSQGGGTGTMGTIISNSIAHTTNVSHSDNTYVFGALELFGVPAGQSDTTYPFVATSVMGLLNGPTNKFGAFQLPAHLSAPREDEINRVEPVIIEPGPLITQIPDGTTLLSTNYKYSFEVPAGEPDGGEVSWWTKVYGTNGISSENVMVQANATNSRLVTVTVTNGFAGSVILHASYSATNGDLIFASPVVVASNPGGTTLTNIYVQPANAILSPGDSLLLHTWGVYTNGVFSQLYLPGGQVAYQSSNPTVAGVDSNGVVTLNTFGTTTITASYNGFNAQSVISSVTPTINMLTGTAVANGAFQLSFMATLGTTNVIQTSSNLIDWIPISTFYNSSGFIQFQDGNATNFSKRFYRVVIP